MISISALSASKSALALAVAWAWAVLTASLSMIKFSNCLPFLMSTPGKSLTVNFIDQPEATESPSGSFTT